MSPPNLLHVPSSSSIHAAVKKPNTIGMTYPMSEGIL